MRAGAVAAELVVVRDDHPGRGRVVVPGGHVFPADSIVSDPELIRNDLGVERWSVLGQSFGGFCVLRYLSSAAGGLAEAFLTGGLPPVGRYPDEVYRATYARTLQRCRRYYERYPADRERARQLQKWMAENEAILPNGDRLTPRMFRQLGWVLGMSDGAEKLRYILELPAGSPAFLHDVEEGLPPFSRNPLYAVVHEASHSDGDVTNWSAARVQPEEYQEQPELHGRARVPLDVRGLRRAATLAGGI